MTRVDWSVRPAAAGDWSPLAGADPVPGDAPGLLVLAARYESAAQDVGRQVSALRRLDAGSGAGVAAQWQGPAATAYAGRAGSLPGDLDLVGARLLRVAQALRAFAVVLEGVQRRARAALALARSAAAAPPGHGVAVGPAPPVLGGGLSSGLAGGLGSGLGSGLGTGLGTGIGTGLGR